MQIAIVSGSHRLKSQSSKVARFAAGLVQRDLPDCRTVLLDLAGNPLPLWDEGVWSKTDAWREAWRPYGEALRASDAIVVVSPEWAGMVPPGLKNFLLLASGDEVGDKPGLIVTVSSGMGGAYPVAELRHSGTKNNFLCWIPQHVVIRRVETLLNDGPAASPDDQAVRDRLAYSLRVLAAYGRALRGVRESGVLDRKTYPYGT